MSFIFIAQCFDESINYASLQVLSFQNNVVPFFFSQNKNGHLLQRRQFVYCLCVLVLLIMYYHVDLKTQNAQCSISYIFNHEILLRHDVKPIIHRSQKKNMASLIMILVK